jgi:hypothetical protein
MLNRDALPHKTDLSHTILLFYLHSNHTCLSQHYCPLEIEKAGASLLGTPSSRLVTTKYCDRATSGRSRLLAMPLLALYILQASNCKSCQALLVCRRLSCVFWFRSGGCRCRLVSTKYCDRATSGRSRLLAMPLFALYILQASNCKSCHALLVCRRLSCVFWFPSDGCRCRLDTTKYCDRSTSGMSHLLTLLSFSLYIL